MTIRKLNDFLSLSHDSDADSQADDSNDGYDSEEHEGKASCASKRRKISKSTNLAQDYLSDQDSELYDSEDKAGPSDVDIVHEHDLGVSGNSNDLKNRMVPAAHQEQNRINDSRDYGEHADKNGIEHTNTNKTVNREKLQKASAGSTTLINNKRKKKSLKTGVVYLPRLPPFLKPMTLRNLLTPYTRHGISRLFLTPETAQARTQRIRGGGNKKRLFTDGWVEFHSKTDAKTVVDTCNGCIIGGKKGSYYRDDVWSMRYLRGFKWSDLVSERRDEEVERTSRLEAERRKGKREIALYLGNVEKAKIEETKRKKEAEKREREVRNSAEDSGVGIGGASAKVFSFRQNEIKRKTVEAGRREADKPTEDVQRVLSKIF